VQAKQKQPKELAHSLSQPTVMSQATSYTVEQPAGGYLTEKELSHLEKLFTDGKHYPDNLPQFGS